jgi:hypothetical protein
VACPWFASVPGVKSEFRMSFRPALYAAVRAWRSPLRRRVQASVAGDGRCPPLLSHGERLISPVTGSHSFPGMRRRNPRRSAHISSLSSLAPPPLRLRLCLVAGRLPLHLHAYPVSGPLSLSLSLSLLSDLLFLINWQPDLKHGGGYEELQEGAGRSGLSQAASSPPAPSPPRE